MVLVFGMGSLFSFGQNAGFFGQGSGGGVISLTTNGTSFNTYNWSTNLGDLYSLTLNGGIIHTFKNGSGNICGGTMFWRVYKVGNTPGSYNSLSLTFSANHTFSTTASPSTVNSGGSGDQRWQNISTTNLFNDANISGEVGSCRIDVYFNATGCLSNSSCCTDNFSVGSSGSPLQLSFTKARLSNVASGNWNTAGTWSPSGIPASGESIAILNGNNITLNTDVTISNLIINAGGTFTSNDATNRTLTINTGTSTSATSLTNNGTWTNGAATTTVAFSGSPASSAVISTSGSISFQNVSITSTTSNAYGLAFPGASTSVSGTLTVGKAGYIASITNSSFWGSSSILTFDQGIGETFVLDAGGVTWKTGSEPRPKSVVVNSGTLDIGNSRTVSSAVSTTSLTVNPGAMLTVASGQTLTQSTGGTITLKSTGSGTGSIGNSAGSVSGSVTVERFISSSGRRWRFLSSPVQSKTIADWRSQFAITGPGATNNSTVGDLNVNGWHQTYNNITNATPATSTSVRSYVEANSTSGNLNLGWADVTTATALTAGQGFRAFIRGPISGVTTQLGVNGNSTSQDAVTLSLTGAINSGDITPPAASRTWSGAGRGWNLLGNPFPCAYNFNAHYDANIGAEIANINPTVYVYNSTGGTPGYVSYNASSNTNAGLDGGIIPSGTGFFIEASSTPTFVFKETYKTTTAPVSLHKTDISNVEFGIKYSKDTLQGDYMVVKMFDGATLNSELYDIKKLKNDDLNLSAYGEDTIQLTASCIPFISEETRIKLNVEALEIGTYKFDFTNMDNFDKGISVSLFDRFTNSTTDVKANTKYTFEMGAGVNQWGKNRFELILNGKATTGVNNTTTFKTDNTNLSIYPNPATDVLNINISNANFKNSEVVVYNISGTEILKTNMASSNAQLNIETLSNGVYFVKVSNENGFNKTVKFVK